MVTDLGEGGGGSEFSFEAEFLIGNFGASDADFTEVSFDDLGLRDANDRSLAEVLLIAVDQADRLAGLAGEGALGGSEPERDSDAESAFLVLFPQSYGDRAHHEERIDLRFEVFAVGPLDQLSAGDAFGEFLVDLVRRLTAKNLDRCFDFVGPFTGVMVGVGDLEVERFSEDRGGQVAEVGSVGDTGDSVANHHDFLQALFVETLFSGVGVRVGDRDTIASADFQDSVVGDRLVEAG